MLQKLTYYCHRVNDICKIHFRKKQVLQYYKNHPLEAEKFKEELGYLRHSETHYAQCRSIRKFRKTHSDEISCIDYDSDKKLWYVIYKERRMYLKRSMTRKSALKYFTSILFEQEEGAHKYLDTDFSVENESMILDCGAAEGFFVLSVMDKVKEAWLFECDPEWIEALSATFEHDSNVHIVEKYVSDREDKESIRLDTMSDLLSGEKIFIKMDIEGAEVKALEGARELIRKCRNLKAAICAYHRQEDEKTIRCELDGMKIVKSKGWLCPLYPEWEMKPPYFRTGVLRIKK